MEAHCDREAIKLGDWLSKTYRDKHYSVSSEVASVFIPEERATVYVLESYERAYLALNLALIYYRNGKKERAAVELRRAYSEGQAQIYNFGEDAPNLLLAAALWENLGEPDTARSYWVKLAEIKTSQATKDFAEARIRDIDENRIRQREPWKIFTVGRFPKLDWSLSFRQDISKSYYEITTVERFPKNCSSRESLVLNSSQWLEKIRMRYAENYHPLLNFKSWVRIPIGIAYSAGAIALGAGVATGGCALDGALDGNHNGGGAACGEAIKFGYMLIAESFNLIGQAMRPDLRHWNQVPMALMISRADKPLEEECWNTLDHKLRLQTIDLLTKPKIDNIVNSSQSEAPNAL